MPVPGAVYAAHAPHYWLNTKHNVHAEQLSKQLAMRDCAALCKATAQCEPRASTCGMHYALLADDWVHKAGQPVLGHGTDYGTVAPGASNSPTTLWPFAKTRKYTTAAKYSTTGAQHTLCCRASTCETNRCDLSNNLASHHHKQLLYLAP